MMDSEADLCPIGQSAIPVQCEEGIGNIRSGLATTRYGKDNESPDYNNNELISRCPQGKNKMRFNVNQVYIIIVQ